MNVATDRFLTPAETCAMLNISRATYLKLKRTGQFPIPAAPQQLVKHDRYRCSDVESYVRSGRQE